MPTVLQILDPSGTSINFTTQQPSGVPTFPPAEITSKKASQITSSGLNDQPSGSPSVAVILHTITLPSIVPTTFP